MSVKDRNSDLSVSHFCSACAEVISQRINLALTVRADAMTSSIKHGAAECTHRCGGCATHTKTKIHCTGVEVALHQTFFSLRTHFFRKKNRYTGVVISRGRTYLAIRTNERSYDLGSDDFDNSDVEIAIFQGDLRCSVEKSRNV